MNKLASPVRWYTPWRSAAAANDDPADLGTAFGLDLSMAPIDMPLPVVRPKWAKTASWLPRWVRRRRHTS